jgi:hypothetical protein
VAAVSWRHAHDEPAQHVPLVMLHEARSALARDELGGVAPFLASSGVFHKGQWFDLFDWIEAGAPLEGAQQRNVKPLRPRRPVAALDAPIFWAYFPPKAVTP